MNKDAYYYQLKKGEDFTATVLSCEAVEKAPEGLKAELPLYCVSLSREGFYPEGGGQPSDRGWIGEAEVLLVRESLHYVSAPLEVGKEYPCRLDWEWRNRNSQNHSGEHIISGLVHQRYGYDNVGFHMAMEESVDAGMTIDFDGEISWEELLSIEREANRLVRENLDVRIFFPEEEELKTLPYRSKKELHGLVRLVEIPGADLCACCGTHVEKTGEIGMIKLLSMVRHRGGIRVTMVCGDLAVQDYERKLDSAVAAAQMLSVPVEKLPEAVDRQKKEAQEKDFRTGCLNEKYFKLKAELLRTSPLICEFEEDFNAVEVRKYCDYLMKHTEAKVVGVFLRKPGEPGPKGEYVYVIGSESVSLREPGKKFNQLASGRGGGKDTMLQGTVLGEEQQIRESFDTVFSELLEKSAE